MNKNEGTLDHYHHSSNGISTKRFIGCIFTYNVLLHNEMKKEWSKKQYSKLFFIFINALCNSYLILLHYEKKGKQKQNYHVGEVGGRMCPSSDGQNGLQLRINLL